MTARADLAASSDGKWMETLSFEVYGDPYVSGKYRFELWYMDDGEMLLDSGYVYSTRGDAEQAASDAAHAAWRWRNL